MTKVLFLLEEKEIPFAFFPDLVCDHKGNLISYSHIGQHSACSRHYAMECEEAKHYQYCDLLKELISVGYKNLFVMNIEAIGWDMDWGLDAEPYDLRPLNN